MGVADTWRFRDVCQRDTSVDSREIAHALIETESLSRLPRSAFIGTEPGKPSADRGASFPGHLKY